MIFTEHYDSPLGGILLAADEIGLTGLWLDGQKYFGGHLSAERRTQETPILTRSQTLAGYLFYRQRAGFPSSTASRRLCIPAGGMEDSSTDSIREDHDIRRDCTAACRTAGT